MARVLYYNNYSLIQPGEWDWSGILFSQVSGSEWYIVQPGKWDWSGILFSQVSGTGVIYCSAK